MLENHNNARSDIWTNVGAVGEAVSGLISDSYWLATSFDIASRFEEDVMGLSYYGLAFGVIVGLLSAGGAAYCHRQLNTSHQNEPQNNQRNQTDYDTIQQSSDSSDNCAIAIQETPAAENIHPSTDDQDSSSEPLVTRGNKKLTTAQKVALAGDFISHTGENAGPITFVASLATQGALPRWGKSIVQVGATLFGAATSVANVRTCKNNLAERNEDQPSRLGSVTL